MNLKLWQNILLAGLLAGISCQNKVSTLSGKPLESPRSESDSLAGIILKKFGLPYSKDVIIDTNALIFYRDKPLDTSFVLHILKSANQIDAVYYEMLPDYHRDINDYADSKAELLFFQGYSFKLDSGRWDQIKRAAQKLSLTTNTPSKAGGCADCGFSSIIFNYKSKLSDRGNRSQFESFARFLKDSLLYQVIKKRKPIRH